MSVWAHWAAQDLTRLILGFFCTRKLFTDIPLRFSPKTFFDLAVLDPFALSSLKNLFVLPLKLIWAGTPPTIPVGFESFLDLNPSRDGTSPLKVEICNNSGVFGGNFVGRRDVTAAFWCPNCYTRNGKLCHGSFSFFPDKSFLFFPAKPLYLSLIFIWLNPFLFSLESFIFLPFILPVFPWMSGVAGKAQGILSPNHKYHKSVVSPLSLQICKSLQIKSACV